MSIADAALESRIAALEALRNRLAVELDRCESARDIAALSNRFQECLRDLAELKPDVIEKPATSLDEVRQRREARVKKTG